MRADTHNHPIVPTAPIALNPALGQPVSHAAVSPEAFRAFGFPGADDLGNLFQFIADVDREFSAIRDVARSRALNPSLKDFGDWLSANKDRIPIG